jgi:RND family efflux transporter MFP subunit
MKCHLKSRRALVVGLVAVLAAAVWLIRTTPSVGDGASESDPTGAALAVRTATAREEQWQETIEAFGNIMPWEEMIVSAQIEGQPLVELRANVGDRVWRGQVLARFDDVMLLAEVEKLRAENEQAAAEVEQADSERDRALELGDSGGVSEQEIIQRISAAKIASARLRASRAQLSVRELDLRRATVVAPDHGTISVRNAQVGMVGTPGLELFRIIRHDRLEWRGELSAAELNRAARGQAVSLTLPGGIGAQARIRQLAPSLNPQTRLANLYADIEPGSAARAGAYVSGRIELGPRSALVVPASAIVVRDGYGLVFTVESDGAARRARQRRVEVGRQRASDAEVISGLVAGEVVVERGAGFLDDGDVVRIGDSGEAR